jgi:L,D-peptidoglycan transpeptidase YkuD (ErfK/YbiS/YcfS/YnhG family)
MKNILSLFILLFSFKINLIISLEYDISKLQLSKKTDQIMLVIPPNKQSTSAEFLFYVKEGNEWMEYIKCKANIGKDGIGETREGIPITPVGSFKFTKCFGTAENPGTKLNYTKINEYHYWISDSNSDRYNQFVDIREYDKFNKEVGEHLIEYQDAYEYAMNINYNEKGEPGKGSAIFLHCMTKTSYTGGCVAIPRKKMIEVLKKVNGNCQIVIDLKDNLKKY